MLKEKVYSLVKRIPKGRVSTYKIIASKLGTKAYRAVGNALNKNKKPIIPCHKVVKSSANIGFYNKGLKKKIKMLKDEGLKLRTIR